MRLSRRVLNEVSAAWSNERLTFSPSHRHRRSSGRSTTSNGGLASFTGATKHAAHRLQRVSQRPRGSKYPIFNVSGPSNRLVKYWILGTSGRYSRSENPSAEASPASKDEQPSLPQAFHCQGSWCLLPCHELDRSVAGHAYV